MKLTEGKICVFTNAQFWLAVFFIVSALSIFLPAQAGNSRIVGLSLYQLVKLAEFIGFYFYLQSAFGKIFGFRTILITIIASGVFQAAIAIAQYLKQASLGLRLFGESPLSVNTTGVAVFIADGVKYLRAYGTAPHPNVLAAWLFLAIFAFYFYFLRYRDGAAKIRAADVCFLGIYAVLLFGFFFTFSRIIIGLWALGAVIWVLLSTHQSATRFSASEWHLVRDSAPRAGKEGSFIKNWFCMLARGAPLFKKNLRDFLTSAKQRLVTIVAITLIVGSLFTVFYWPQVKSRVLVSAEEEAVTQRVFYNKIAESVATANPLLGIGIGQFVPQLMTKLKHWPPNIYQPVHNIYLLIASETGFVGLAFFLLFLFFVLYNFIRRSRLQKPYHFSFFIMIFSFLLMGLFDHFLWTLQQGSLIFWMTLALVGLNPSE